MNSALEAAKNLIESKNNQNKQQADKVPTEKMMLQSQSEVGSQSEEQSLEESVPRPMGPPE